MRTRAAALTAITLTVSTIVFATPAGTAAGRWSAAPHAAGASAAARATAATAVSPVDYVQPVRGPIVRRFEPPPTPYAAGHRGIDIEAGERSIVIASARGVVAFAGAIADELFVSIDHPDGIRTTYSYLAEVLVRRGEPVEQGRAIARSGRGHAAGDRPHLHFGARRGDDYLDPEELLAASLRRNLWRAVRLAPDPAA